MAAYSPLTVFGVTSGPLTYCVNPFLAWQVSSDSLRSSPLIALPWPSSDGKLVDMTSYVLTCPLTSHVHVVLVL